MSRFTKARRQETFIKLAITGPSGSGKTYGALRLARGLVGPNGRIAVIDTENNSATLYNKLTDFDHTNIRPPFDSMEFMNAADEAEQAGYGAVIIDSGTHLWQGILDWKTKIDQAGGNHYTNWAGPSKAFGDAVNKFLQSKIHVIFCLRSKMDYVLEDNDKGKKVPVKVGLAPIMRDGIEYEFTTVFDVAMTHLCRISKDRTGLFGPEYFQITEEIGERIADWLRDAEPIQEPPQTEFEAFNDYGDETLVAYKRVWSTEPTMSMVELNNRITAYFNKRAVDVSKAELDDLYKYITTPKNS